MTELQIMMALDVVVKLLQLNFITLLQKLLRSAVTVLIVRMDAILVEPLFQKQLVQVIHL